MKFINRGRQTGKSTILIHTAFVTGYPIITFSDHSKKFLLEQAEKIGCEEIRVYSINEWRMERLSGRCDMSEKILIDESRPLIEIALNEYLHADVVAGTLTLPMELIGMEEMEKEFV